MNNCLLPLTIELIYNFCDSDTYTKLDIQIVFGNLQGAEGNKEKQTFLCQAGQFAPLTTSFWPTRAPGYFQYFIYTILLGSIGKGTAIPWRHYGVHQERCGSQTAGSQDPQARKKQSLWFNLKNCEFLKSKVKCLGLVTYQDRVQLDLAKWR